jgi:hypothetical protein
MGDANNDGKYEELFALVVDLLVFGMEIPEV